MSAWTGSGWQLQVIPQGHSHACPLRLPFILLKIAASLDEKPMIIMAHKYEFDVVYELFQWSGIKAKNTFQILHFISSDSKRKMTLRCWLRCCRPWRRKSEGLHRRTRTSLASPRDQNRPGHASSQCYYCFASGLVTDSILFC